MKTLADVETEILGLVSMLRTSADKLDSVGDELLHDASGATPWKLRRAALQFEEMVARIGTRYEKLLAKETK